VFRVNQPTDVLHDPVTTGVGPRTTAGGNCPTRFSAVTGRNWWAHIDFAPINIELTIGEKEIEESLRFRREDASGGEAPGLSGTASVPGTDPAIVFADHGCCRSVRIRIPAPFTLSALFEAL